MADISSGRVSLAEDLTRLINALPGIINLPRDDPRVVAWSAWERALTEQVRQLELQERGLVGDPYLWISQAHYARETATG